MRSGNRDERLLNHVNTGFCENPTGSSHHQTIEMTNSKITIQASVLVSIATPTYNVSGCRLPVR